VIERRRLKILFIRSDGQAATDGRQALVDAGHIVAEVSNGPRAAHVLRTRAVNLVLVENGDDELSLIEVISSLRGEGGVVSARYTPIFALVDQSKWRGLPRYIDGVVSLPIDTDQLMSTYLEFLSKSLNARTRGAEMTPCCEIDASIDRLGGDVELYKDLVDRFLDDRAGTRARVRDAIERADMPLLHSASHSLKGLAASVGATTVAAILGELEELGRSGDPTALLATWQRFQSAMESTAEELAPYHRRMAEVSTPHQ